MTLTAAELTVLALVVEEPRHGYDLERIIEERGIRRWTDIGFSSIYYVLTKLETRGLVAAEKERARARRVFQATTEGRRVAADEARAFIADPRAVHDPVLIGLANRELLVGHDYAAALRARLQVLDGRIAAIRHAQQAQSPLPLPASEVFSFRLRLLEAERSWLAERVEGSDV